MGNCFLNVSLDVGYDSVTSQLGILGAYFCGDGETGRNGHAQQVHFCQIGALTAKKVSHVRCSFGLTVAECIYFLRHKMINKMYYIRSTTMP